MKVLLKSSRRASVTMTTSSGLLKAVMVVLYGLSTASSQEHYYSYNRGGHHPYVGRSDVGLLDALQRGQEGLLVQLEQLNKALKEDELKLNNVFYKLGRHDTDIQSTSQVQVSLRNMAQKLEAKLSKQSFNVDYLRRHVTDLKRSVIETSSTSASVTALQKTVSDLQVTLAQALYRTSQLENKTKELETSKRDPPVYSDGFEENNIYYASRAPKTTYYYMDGHELAGVCDELQGWTVTANGGCWWVGHESLSYREAISKCASKSAYLAQPPTNDTKWIKHYTKLFLDNPREIFWTSATTVFSDSWTYMFTGSLVPTQHWADDVLSSSQTGNRKCAGVTSAGLVAYSCNMSNSYICEKIY